MQTDPPVAKAGGGIEGLTEVGKEKLDQESQESPIIQLRATATWKDKAINLSNLLGYMIKEH